MSLWLERKFVLYESSKDSKFNANGTYVYKTKISKSNLGIKMMEQVFLNDEENAFSA